MGVWSCAPNLYRALRRYGSRPVTRLIRQGDDSDWPDDDGDTIAARLDESEKALINQIWEGFKGYEAFQLSALTHQDRSPWKNAYVEGERNRPISNNSIQDYFSEIADAPAS